MMLTYAVLTMLGGWMGSIILFFAETWILNWGFQPGFRQHSQGVPPEDIQILRSIVCFNSPVQICELGFLEPLECCLRVQLHQKGSNHGAIQYRTATTNAGHSSYFIYVHFHTVQLLRLTIHWITLGSTKVHENYVKLHIAQPHHKSYSPTVVISKTFY